MNNLKVGNIILGEGIPKICVPLTGADRAALASEIQEIAGKPHQLVEWRADYMIAAMREASLWEVVRELLGTLGFLKSSLDEPVLFTIRTFREGGEAEISEEDYLFINRMIAESRMADMIDIEAFTAYGTDLAAEFIRYAHDTDNVVLLSNHDFEKTPSLDEMIKKYAYMNALDGDVAKLAVMPHAEDDVVRLLEAAAITSEQYPEKALVAISMGELGMSSRLCAGQFGSVITFASGKASSAPGQIDAETLQGYMERYYK